MEFPHALGHFETLDEAGQIVDDWTTNSQTTRPQAGSKTALTDVWLSGYATSQSHWMDG